MPPPPVSVHVVYTINGAEGEIRNVARTPIHDDKGEKWSMPLAVVPPFSVEALPATQIVLAGANPSAQSELGVRTTADRGNGTVHPEAPQGWTIEPQSADGRFTAPGQKSVAIQGAAGRREGRLVTKCTRFLVPMAATTAMATRWSRVPISAASSTIQPALQRASIVEVKIPQGLKIGYIMGAGDDIPDVLRELGLNVTLLTADDVEHGDLSRYGTIILGIRAYDTQDAVEEEQPAPARLRKERRHAAGAVQHFAQRL